MPSPAKKKQLALVARQNTSSGGKFRDTPKLLLELQEDWKLRRHETWSDRIAAYLSETENHEKEVSIQDAIEVFAEANDDAKYDYLLKEIEQVFTVAQRREVRQSQYIYETHYRGKQLTLGQELEKKLLRMVNEGENTALKLTTHEKQSIKRWEQRVTEKQLQSPAPAGYTNPEPGKEPGTMPDRAPPKRKLPNSAKSEFAHKPPSKLPGYVPDSRLNTVALTAHVPLALRTAIHNAAKKSKIPTQEYLVAILTAAAAQQQPDQEPVKVDAAKAIEEHLKGKRAAARKAALRLAASLR